MPVRGGSRMHSRSSGGAAVATDKEISSAIDKLTNALRILRSAATTHESKKQIELTPTQTQLLLHIAKFPGVSQKELISALGVTYASVSRNVATLGHRHALSDRDGFELLEAVQDPDDARRQMVFLTNKGKHFVSKLLSAQLPGEEVDLENVTYDEWRKSGKRR
jgi:DNA-binding MarR family transcriptional regulator